MRGFYMVMRSYVETATLLGTNTSKNSRLLMYKKMTTLLK